MVWFFLVALPDGVVIGVVGGGDLHDAGAELGIDENVVGDDGDFSVVKGSSTNADGPVPAGVLGVDGEAVSPNRVSGRVVATVMKIGRISEKTPPRCSTEYRRRNPYPDPSRAPAVVKSRTGRGDREGGCQGGICGCRIHEIWIADIQRLVLTVS